MHLSNIIISQFKSFRNKIELHNLSEKVNIIVGKNGSGKSNLVGAISTLFSAQKFTMEEKQSMIHDGNVLSTNKAEISVYIRNNDRFPFKEDFIIRRDISLKEDSFHVSEHGQKECSPTKEEIFGIFESSNLTNSNLFIVQQGKISYFATLDDDERYELIKDIAGANIYEKDRKECHEMLSESTDSIEKIKGMLKNIQDKIRYLEKDKIILMEFENNEREKRRIEKAIYEKEILEIEEKLENFEDDVEVEHESEENEDFDERIMVLNKKTEEIHRKIDFENLDESQNFNVVENDIKNLKDQEGLLNKETFEMRENIKKLKIALKDAKISTELEKHINVFYEELKTKDNLQELNNEIMDLQKKANNLKYNQKQEHEDLDHDEIFRLLEDYIEKRNKLWTDEKKNENIRGDLKEEYQICERNLIAFGGNSFVAYQNFRHNPGIHGCVFELINIPDELYVAVESVARSSLFHVVVDNDKIATDLCKNVKERITFIPLNRIDSRENNLNIEDAILLSSVIKCKPEYKPILNYITKDSYLVSDIKTGILLSRTHNINVITIDGDFISKKGAITGGYEKKNTVFKGLKQKENEIRQLDKKQIELKAMIKDIENKIEDLKNKPIRKNTMQDSFPELEVKIIDRKLSILKKFKNDDNFKDKLKSNIVKGLSVLKDYEAKTINIEHRVNRDEIKLKELSFKRNQNSSKLAKILRIRDNLALKNTLTEIESELDKLTEIRNEKLKKKVYGLKDKENYQNFDSMKIKIEKNVLMEKKINLIKKIGMIQDDKEGDNYRNLENKELLNLLKDINTKLKKNISVNRRAVFQYDDFFLQKEGLGERLTELIEEREKIVDFINELDIKKSEKISLTFSMIKDNFSYFFHKLSPNNRVDLILENKKIMIKLNNDVLINLKNLSGGQKTLLALSLIFSIQRIDPSPFYFFDEIDANLDKESRINVAKLIKEVASSDSPAQFFITTFREEVLLAGDKFYGVTYENKTTVIEEISSEAAFSFVSESKISENVV